MAGLDSDEARAALTVADFAGTLAVEAWPAGSRCSNEPRRLSHSVNPRQMVCLTVTPWPNSRLRRARLSGSPDALAGNR